jgi:hypothetical protein
VFSLPPPALLGPCPYARAGYQGQVCPGLRPGAHQCTAPLRLLAAKTCIPRRACHRASRRIHRTGGWGRHGRLAIPWRGRRPQTRRCHRRTCHSESKYRGSGSLVLGRTSINANQIRRRANREGNQYAAPARGPHDRLDRPLWRRHDSSCSMQLEACHWRSSLLLNHASRRRPSVPLVPTLVSLCSTSVYKRRNQRDTSNSMNLVRLWI